MDKKVKIVGFAMKKQLNSAGVWKRLARTGFPLLLALLAVTALILPIRFSDTQTPSVEKGVLDLSEWPGDNPFEISGDWEFYWDRLLTSHEIGQNGRSSGKGGASGQSFIYADAPGFWNSYDLNGEGLPGKGKATYRVHVTGAEAGVQYGVRIQDMSSVYRLYIDDALVAQNGSFGDTESASASDYRPQFAAFTPAGDSFDLILQISNDAYGIGGMWEPVIFGTYKKISAFNKLISYADAAATASLIMTCLFFLIFFAVQRGEKDMLILSGVGMLILLRFLMNGDVALSAVFPGISLALVGRIEYLTSPWTQFLLLYFVYYVYGNLVRRWQIAGLFTCAVGLSLFILLFPFPIVIASYGIINAVLLLVIAFTTAQLTRAAWQGREGASLLLGAFWLITLLIFYDQIFPDRSTGYYLLTNLHFEYMVFVFAQVAVVALRYRRAQELEIAHLKGQIRPHFIHNALTSIISISRTDPDRARDLLVDFSSYLRGFYDYEKDELVSFSQELELVRAYVSLEQARFGEKLRVEYRVDTDDFLIPSLILQPLVENAFIHGLREKDDGGTVTIYTCRISKGKVRVGVRDDGAGLSLKSAPTRRGVGIENINRRLARLYRTSLVYLVPKDGGCEVYLEIPYQEEMKHESMDD